MPRYGIALAAPVLIFAAACAGPAKDDAVADPSRASATAAATGDNGGAPVTAENSGGAAAAAGNSSGAPGSPDGNGGTAAAAGNSSGAPGSPDSVGGTAAATGRDGSNASDAGAAAMAQASSISGFPAATGSLEGQPAPDFALELKSGEKVALSALRGRVVVVNFWATWCRPCVEELPSLERLRRQLKGTSIEIVGVSVDENWAAVDKLLSQHPVQFPILLDTAREVPGRYGTSKFPETFVVDKEGRVVRKLIGAQVWDRGDFVTWLRQLAA